MSKIDLVEGNIIHAFNKVKADIIRLQDDFMQLRENQIRILNRLSRLDSQKSKSIFITKSVASKNIKKISSKKHPSHKKYLASREGKKFHLPNCPYAQNIKPKSKVVFKTKAKALNLGYKPCSCIK